MRQPAASIAAAISAAFNGRALAVLALVAPLGVATPDAFAAGTPAVAQAGGKPAQTAQAGAKPASAASARPRQKTRQLARADGRPARAKLAAETPRFADGPVPASGFVTSDGGRARSPAEGGAKLVRASAGGGAAMAAGVAGFAAASGSTVANGPLPQAGGAAGAGTTARGAIGMAGGATGGIAGTAAASGAMRMAAAGGAAQAAAPAGANAGGSDLVSLNFVNADLDAVVGAIGQMTNRTFIVDPRVRGQVTLATPNPVPRAEAYRMLLSVLRLQGFSVVEDGSYAKVLPEADAKLQSGPVAGLVPGNRGDQIVTQIFRLNYESASAMVPVLRPLISPNNTITAYPSNNSLVITDYAENIRRIEKIITSVDVPAAAELEVIPLKFGLAVDMAALLTRMVDDSQRGGQTDPGQKVTIVADQRSNALLLRASSKARADSVRNLVAKLDIPSAGRGNINVVYLKNADAVKLAATLRAIINADTSGSNTNSSSGSGFLSGGSGTGGTSGTSGSGGLGGNSGSFGSSGSSSTSGFGGTGSGSSGGFLGGSSSSQSGFGASGTTGQQGGIVQADPATNTLIITAPEPVYRNLRDIIEKLDARRAQVFIEALIVEVSADKTAEMGIQWQDLSGLTGSGTNLIGGTNFGSTGTNILTAAANVASVGQGLNLGLVRGSITINGTTYTNFGVLARALETNTNANVLSTPNLLTLDNEEAKIVVGQNVPFITGQYTNASSTSSSSSTVNPFQTIERKDVGLTLHVKPAVSEGGGVRMQIHQEVSAVVSTTLSSGIITNTRQIDSSVVVDDGQIIVLGGLVQDEITDSVSKVPLLGDIPYLGALFRYSSRERKKTNLMVFLRPRIIRNLADSQSVTVDRYDYMRVRTSEQQPAPSFILPDTRGMQLPALDGSYTIKPPAMLMQPAPGDARTPESATTPQGGGANAAGQPSQRMAPGGAEPRPAPTVPANPDAPAQ
ncbi:type II secretion system secretin GspD [Derxia gummosa]|uniref:Type II secretion system secretin GspD n=1 Tax=Derxia gummosa DSM 723 TaxID=1121388 RepID=A0A9U5GSW3_9BURK|nr:type II secretion system secretin GspD [Derxia gummosa]